MHFALSGLPLGFLTAFAIAQSPDGSDRPRAADPRIMLEYGQFDPLASTPPTPPRLQAGADINLYVVQFHSTPTDADRAAIERAGGVIKGYLPHDCHLVMMRDGIRLLGLNEVRWVGHYEPAYRLESFLLAEIAAGAPVPTRKYNIVMVDKRRDKAALTAKITALGGEVADQHIGGLLFTVSLTGAQLLQAARLDEVLWIDRWTPPERDMDNARIQGGANTIETLAGYTGAGIRGHVYEGVESTHPDFNVAMTPVGPALCNVVDTHGHCTAGIIFGNGNSAPQARGMAPDAIGFFTHYVSSTNATCAQGLSRNTILGTAVNINNCMFTTASWGQAQTTLYTSDSADADDIVFDHRIPWTNSMSNLGNQNARPQAWAKNVISVGGVQHFNNSNAADDSWLAGNGSIGPAQDGRNKPDLAAYYDSVWTSDLSGASGYNTAAGVAGNSTTGFGGTSAATPIVAGHNALAIQMYTDHLFTPPRVQGGTRFQNRPYAQTVKALQIACANMYTPTATDNRREHVGYGFPSLANMYNRRDRISIIPEDVAIAQGQTHTYEFSVLPGETIIKFCMTYLDPAGNPAAAFDRVNDLTMRVTSPGGTQYWGNNGLDGATQTNQSASGGAADTFDTVECVVRNNPTPGIWTVTITAPTVTVDANLSVPGVNASYALVVNGGRRVYGSDCARYLPDNSTTFGSGNYFPWGGYAPTNLSTTFASNNGGGIGGTVYFDVTVTNPVWIHSLELNTGIGAGTEVYCDLYTKNGTHVGSELNAAAWTARTAGNGVAAAIDTPTQIDLSEPFRLAAGTYGFAVVAKNFGHRYTSAANTISNADLQITFGSATNGAFSSAVNTPREANINLKHRAESAQAQNMRYQTILRRDELGAAGTITELSFSGQSNGRHYNSNLQVRMAHVPAGSTLSTTFATNLPGSVLVLNSNTYSFNYANGQWRGIGLQTPFAYNGTSDVVVDIVARGNVQTTTGSGVGPFEVDPNRQRVYATGWNLTPTTGTFADNNALRMRVSFDCAHANEHGASCGALVASHTGDGRVGQTFNFRVNNATPNFLAFIGLGTSNAFPYPFSLTPIGFTNCTAFSQSDVILNIPTDGAGTGVYGLAVPNNLSLSGTIVFGQWVSIDTSEPGDLTFSNLTRMIVGRAE
jgi:serine protease AprX